MSQPTVSRALNQMRQLLADPLLVRSAGKLFPTERAASLIGPLEEWLALTSRVLIPGEFSPSTLDRQFTIATTDYGVLSVLSPVLPRLHWAAPGCRIEVSRYSSDMLRRLATGELDVIVYGFPPDLSVVHARHLFRETQSVIVRRGHPIVTACDGTRYLDEYLAWPHVALSVGPDAYDHVDTCLGERKAERRVSVRLPYFHAAPDLIGGSDAILTLPTRAATRFAQLHDFVLLPAPPPVAGFDYWAIWHERSTRDPAILWLIDMLSDTASDVVHVAA